MDTPEKQGKIYRRPNPGRQGATQLPELYLLIFGRQRGCVFARNGYDLNNENEHCIDGLDIQDLAIELTVMLAEE